MKYFSLIFAAIFRKPVRSFLTLASIFIAFLLFGMLQAVSLSFSQGIDFSGVDRLVVSPKYSIIDDIPVSYENQIRSIAGVEEMTVRSWFGGTYKDNKNFFPRWPVAAESFLKIYPEFELTDVEKSAFVNTRTGAIIGQSIAELYGLKVGDKIPIIPNIWPNKDNATWEFDLVGIFKAGNDNVDDKQMFINHEFFDEYRQFGQGGVGNIIVQISDPDRGAEIASQIDAMFANSNDETKTTTEKAYNQMFAKQIGDIGLIMTGILSAVFFTILLLTGNTMAQAVRERIPELAILKTIGFSNTNVLLIVLAESVLVSLLGGLAGLGVAAFLVPGLGQTVSFLNGIEVTNGILLQGFTFAMLLGIVVGLPPAIRAMRLSIVDALRSS